MTLKPQQMRIEINGAVRQARSRPSLGVGENGRPHIPKLAAVLTDALKYFLTFPGARNDEKV